MLWKTAPRLLAVGLLASASPAALSAPLDISFLGSNGAFDFNAPTGTFDGSDSANDSFGADGLTIDFTASVVNNTGNLNATGDFLGINADGAGDDTDELDGENGAESITLVFSLAPGFTGTFTGIDIGGFGGSDAGTLTVNGGTPIALASGLVSAGSPAPDLDGLQLVVSQTAGSFGVEGISIDLVPEPNSLALLGLGTAAILTRSRR